MKEHTFSSSEELLKSAFREAAEQDIKELEAAGETLQIRLSDRHKRKMNRLFRERVGSKQIPHPEVDTAFERIRSTAIRAALRIRNSIRKKNQA